MKRIIANIIFTAGLLLAVGCWNGCATTAEGRRVIDLQKAEDLAPAISASVSSAVIYAYSKDTNATHYIMVVRSTLEQFILSPDLNPAKLEYALFLLPVKELKTPEAQLIITPILAAYKIFWERQVKQSVDANPGLKVLVQAMIDGVVAGEDAVRRISTS